METTNELERWQQVAAQVSSSRTLSPSRIQSSAEALSDLVRTLPDVSTILREFNLLPTGAAGRSIVGRALGDCFEEIPSDKASRLWDWVQQQPQQDSDLVRVNALPGLFAKSPKRAFEVLAEVVTTPTKDLRERLASALAHVSATQLSAGFADQEVYLGRRVCKHLLSAANEAKASANVRFAVLEVVLPVCERLELFGGPISLRSEIDAVLSQLTDTAKEELVASMSESIRFFLTGRASGVGNTNTVPEQITQPVSLAPAASELSRVSAPTEVPPLPSEPQAPSTPTAVALPPSEPPSALTPSPARPIRPSTPDPVAWFDANIQLFAQGRKFCIDSTQEAEEQRKLRVEAEKQTARMKTELARSEQQIIKLASLQHSLAEQTEEIRLLLAENLALKTDEARLAREAVNFRKKDAETARELAALCKANEEQSSQAQLEFATAQQRFRLQAQAEQKTYQRSLRHALLRVLQHFPRENFVPSADIAKNLHVIVSHVLEVLDGHDVKVFDEPRA